MHHSFFLLLKINIELKETNTIKTANENEMLLYIINTYIYLEYVYVQSTVEKKFLLSS